MSDDQSMQSEENSDSKADVHAIIIVFTAAVLMAMVFVSGFTFDF